MATPTYKENWGSREYTLNRDGGNGTRIFRCAWEDRKKIVKQGDPFPGEPRLRCYEINVKPLTPNTSDNAERPADQCIVEARYAVKKNLDTKPQITLEAGGKVLETGLGRTWQGTGKPVLQSQGVFFATCIWNITMIYPSGAPLATIMNNLNKVNAARFLGAASETLLLESANISARYDYENDLWYDEVAYRFNWQSCPWNVVWRAPVQARDAAGLVWTGAQLDEPVWVSGPAGVGGWDRMSPELYSKTDFGPMLNMPPSRGFYSSDDDGFGGNKSISLTSVG